MATCRTTYHGHREGWGPVSTLREFDLTPCFEDGIVLSTLLVVLLVVSLFRLCGIKSKPADHTLTTRSASVLKAKMVRSVGMLPVSMTGIVLYLTTSPFANPNEYRSCSGLPSPSAWQTSPSSFSAMSAFRSSGPTSSNRSPYFPQSSSLTPTINKPRPPLQPSYSSGPPTPSPSSSGDVLSSPPIPRTSVISSFHSPSDPPSRCSDSSHSDSNCSHPSSNLTSTGRSTRHMWRIRLHPRMFSAGGRSAT